MTFQEDSPTGEDGMEAGPFLLMKTDVKPIDSSYPGIREIFRFPAESNKAKYP